MLLPALLLALSCAAALASEPPLPSGPQIAVPEPRLGKGGDCSSACEVCGCDREVDIDRGGNDVGPDGQDQGGGSVGSGHGPMATEEACCQFCRKIPTACALPSPALTGPAPEQPDPFLLLQGALQMGVGQRAQLLVQQGQGRHHSAGPRHQPPLGLLRTGGVRLGLDVRHCAVSALRPLRGRRGGLGCAHAGRRAGDRSAPPHRPLAANREPPCALPCQVKSQPFAVLCLFRAGSSRME